MLLIIWNSSKWNKEQVWSNKLISIKNKVSLMLFNGFKINPNSGKAEQVSMPCQKLLKWNPNIDNFNKINL